MANTLEQIRAAFAPLKKLSDVEQTFEMEGVKFTLARIPPLQEVEVLKFVDPQAEGTSAILATTDAYRHALLSYAIVQINDLDLRASDVDTGERTLEGRAITQAKPDVVRQIVESLDRDLTVAMMARYGEMMEHQGIKIRKATVWNPVELDLEIEFLKTRIEELEAKKESALALARESNPVLAQAQQGVTYFQQTKRPPAPLTEPEETESGSFQDAEEVLPSRVAPHVAARARGLRESP